MRRRTVFLVFALLLPACYHATITTGATPGPVQIEKPWASAWIAGLVPPSTVETMEQCPAGVARVETQLSFLNQLVSALTMGIYTPMQIVVTCAEESDGNMVEARSPAQADALLRSGEPFRIWLR
jgi:hypothetical protein